MIKNENVLFNKHKKGKHVIVSSIKWTIYNVFNFKLLENWQGSISHFRKNIGHVWQNIAGPDSP